MKDLIDWYGEYTTPPSPPIQRSQLARQNSSSTTTSSPIAQSSGIEKGQGRRLTPFNSDSNPFANFGKFGVDGGLMGEPLEMLNRRGGGERGERGVGGRNKNEESKDLAPHLMRNKLGGGGLRDDVVPPWASSRDSESTTAKRGDNLNGRALSNNNNRLGTGERSSLRNNGGGGLEGSSGLNGKERDRRGVTTAADEGGWRSVGTTREGELITSVSFASLPSLLSFN